MGLRGGAQRTMLQLPRHQQRVLWRRQGMVRRSGESQFRLVRGGAALVEKVGPGVASTFSWEQHCCRPLRCCLVWHPRASSEEKPSLAYFAGSDPKKAPVEPSESIGQPLQCFLGSCGAKDAARWPHSAVASDTAHPGGIAGTNLYYMRADVHRGVCKLRLPIAPDMLVAIAH